MRDAALMMGGSAVMAFALCACAETSLHSNMSDAELARRIGGQIHRDTPAAEVAAKLDALGVPERWRLSISGPEGEIRLARIFGPGGFWPRQHDGVVEWVDAAIVVSDGHVERVGLFRDSVRYHGNFPVSSPSRALRGRIGRFPLPIPPPVDPLMDAFFIDLDSRIESPSEPGISEQSEQQNIGSAADAC